MRLSLKQKKILKLLSINCRFTNKDIAKSVAISEDAVAYQIKNLIEKEKLAKFNTQFVHFNLGYKSYHIWIKLGEIKPSLEEIKKIPHSNSVNSNYGKYDYQILVYTKTKKELAESISYIKKKIKPKILSHSKLESVIKPFTNVHPKINVPVKIPKNKKKFEYTLSEETYADPMPNQKNKITTIDKKIIKELIKNPRAKFQEIHYKTKIPLETVRYRIKKYVQTKLINNFGLIHDLEKYETHITYFLFNLKSTNDKELSNYLKKNTDIMYAAKLKGDYNFIIYLFSTSPKQTFKSYSKILEHLGPLTLTSDLLLFNKISKYIQFPEKELE